MNYSEILSLSVTDMVTLLSDKKLSSVEITKAYLDSIGRQQESINAYITVLCDEAIAQAKKAGYDELLKIRQDAYDRYISVTKK